MLNLAQVRDDLLSKLGVETYAGATPLMLQDCTIAINWSLQTLQTAGEDYFTRELLTVGISAGTSFYPIERNVQAVLGPIRLNNEKPLRALTSRGELDQYARIFLGEPEYGVGEGEPEAYWVENLRSGTSGDIVQTNVFLAPKPIASGNIVIEVVDDAPDYVVADIVAGTAVLPVAQNYTESILLPLARMQITRSSQFSRPDLLEQLTMDYQLAMSRLGLAGGFPNVDQQSPERKVEA